MDNTSIALTYKKMEPSLGAKHYQASISKLQLALKVIVDPSRPRIQSILLGTPAGSGTMEVQTHLYPAAVEYTASS